MEKILDIITAKMQAAFQACGSPWGLVPVPGWWADEEHRFPALKAECPGGRRSRCRHRKAPGLQIPCEIHGDRSPGSKQHDLFSLVSF